MTTENNKTKSNKPAYIAYHVRDGEQKGFFTRIGVAFPHSDEQGFNVLIDAMPLNGTITLRLPTEKPTETK